MRKLKLIEKSYELINETVIKMPELPEITVIAKQMNEEIKGKRILDVEAKQPKNLNLPVKKFDSIIKGKTVSNVSSQGKWILLCALDFYGIRVC